MLCRDPFIKDGAAYPCGRCMPCLYNRKRLWTHRIHLEALCHRDSCFLTLTYSDARLNLISERIGGVETGRVLPTLRRKDLQDWLKRLRKAIQPCRIRFYGCGEYGDHTWRPHYHVILFGFKGCLRGMTHPAHLDGGCCERCDLILKTWGLGHIFAGELNLMSAGYVAGYVTKKLSGMDNVRLRGRYPEFSAMSQGIGKNALWEIASQLMAYKLDESMEDVPSAMRHGRVEYPLGRFLRGKLREYVGHENNAPEATLDAIKAELQPLRDFAFREGRSFKEVVVEANAPRVAALEAKNLIFKKRKVL